MGVLLSIVAMYNWRNDIFDTFVIPENMDKELMVDKILSDLGELSIIYNNPDFFKIKVNIWSRSQLPTWDELEKTLHYEYDPIENYDRKEEETVENEQHENTTMDKTVNSAGSDSGSGTDNTTVKDDYSGNNSGNSTQTRDATDSRTLSHDNSTSTKETRDLDSSDHETRNLTKTQTGTDSGTNSEFVAAFNDPDPLERLKNTHSYSTSENSSDTGTVNHDMTDNGTINTTGTDKGTGSDSLKMSGTFSDSGSGEFKENRNVTTDRTTTDTRTLKNETTGKDVGKNDSSGNTKRNMRAHGNIGVTTTQEMIKQQREVVQFNMYDYIVQHFKEEFCLMIW